MKTVYLVRHGETDSNKNFKFQGQIDTQLNEQGLQQAQKLAERLGQIDLAAIYASDLQRAMMTADAVAKAKSMSVIPEPGFREVNFGDWEGLTPKEINAQWPGELEAFFMDPVSLTARNGESFQDLQSRAWAAFQRINAAQEDNTAIMLVMHGGTIRALLCAALHMDLKHIWNISVDNCSVTTLFNRKRYTQDGEYYVLQSSNSLGPVLPFDIR